MLSCITQSLVVYMWRTRHVDYIHMKILLQAVLVVTLFSRTKVISFNFHTQESEGKLGEIQTELKMSSPLCSKSK